MRPARVQLLVTCLVHRFFPGTGDSVVRVLERAGVTVTVPAAQTCCGQPAFNAGDRATARALALQAMEAFSGYDYIVAPSGSCIHHVRDHFTAIEQTEEVKRVRANAYELVEFLHDVLKVDAFPWAEFPHRIGLHNSCGTLRALRTAKMSEINEPYFSKPMDLLNKVKGIEFVTPKRPDECCGFGGTFSVFEEPVSAKMGYDKVADHKNAGAEYIVSADSSCLMHQKGCAGRLGLDIRFIHIAQILNGAHE
jgi:L-lactate dehydrogenase complex protein LldE